MKTIIIAAIFIIMIIFGFFLYQILKCISPEVLKIFKKDRNLDTYEEMNNQNKYFD